MKRVDVNCVWGLNRFGSPPPMTLNTKYPVQVCSRSSMHPSHQTRTVAGLQQYTIHWAISSWSGHVPLSVQPFSVLGAT
jgi:hypothetical protein